MENDRFWQEQRLNEQLRKAAVDRDLPAMERAIAVGADVNCSYYGLPTLLRVACGEKRGNEDIARALLVAGANVDAVTSTLVKWRMVVRVIWKKHPAESHHRRHQFANDCCATSAAPASLDRHQGFLRSLPVQ